VLIAALDAAGGADAPPPGDEIETILRGVKATGAPASDGDEARLRALVASAPERVRRELERVRAQAALLAEVLGDAAGTPAVDAFFAEKLIDARRAYDARAYDRAEQICEAILCLGARDALHLRAQRLLRMARDRAFTDSTLAVDLKPTREIVPSGEDLSFTLVITNRASQRLTIAIDPTGVAGQLELITTRAGQAGDIFERSRTEPLVLPDQMIALGPGESWERELPVHGPAAEEPFLVERVRASGRFVPRRVVVGAATVTRTLRLPLATALRVGSGRAEAFGDPIAYAADAVARGDVEGLFLGTILTAWDGEYEAAVALLLRGTASSSPAVVETSYLLLRLVTGESFGADRDRWIRYYLSHERLPIRGFLSGD
jgi:hypothetical protein